MKIKIYDVIYLKFDRALYFVPHLTEMSILPRYELFVYRPISR